MSFDPSLILGEYGGQLALAFGSGCVAGYGFCMRTVYKLLERHSDKTHQECLDRVISLEREKEELKTRLTVIEDRLFSGQERQLAQVRISASRVIPEILEARVINEDKEDGI